MYIFVLKVIFRKSVAGIILGVLKVRGAYDKFPDFFCIGTFIDSTHMKL